MRDEFHCETGNKTLADINVDESGASWKKGKLTIDTKGVTSESIVGAPEILPVLAGDPLLNGQVPATGDLYFKVLYCDKTQGYTANETQTQVKAPSKIFVIVPECGIKEIKLTLPPPPPPVVAARIEIVVLVDTANIIENLSVLQPGTLSSPTSLGSFGASDNYIYMVAKNGFVSNNQQAKSELQIDAKSGDTIVWNMISFDTGFTPFIYDSHFVLTSGEGAIGLSEVVYDNKLKNVYLPETTKPETSNLIEYVNHAYTASTKVSTVDQNIQYTLSFQLIDNTTGDVKGYFSWDPFITIGS